MLHNVCEVNREHSRLSAASSVYDSTSLVTLVLNGLVYCIFRICTQFEAALKIPSEAATTLVNEQPLNQGEEIIPDRVDVWHFVKP